jgi:large subunit ribosomal protein L27
VAHKKGQGSSRNGRDSNPKMLGIKRHGGEFVWPGCIICKQRGTRWRPGKHVGLGRDFTIWSLVEGYVHFNKKARRISVLPVGVKVTSPSAEDRQLGSATATRAFPSKSKTATRSSGGRTQHSARSSPHEPLKLLPAHAGSFLLKLLSNRGGVMAEEIKDLVLRVDHGSMVNSRAFGVRLDVPGRILSVPPALWELAQMHSIAMASGLVDLITTFPTTVAKGLSLPIERVSAESLALVDIVRGHIDDDFLVDTSPAKRGYGYLVD